MCNQNKASDSANGVHYRDGTRCTRWEQMWKIKLILKNMHGGAMRGQTQM